MNGNIKIHKAQGPAFMDGEIWYSANGSKVTVLSCKLYNEIVLQYRSAHASDFEVEYMQADGTIYCKDAWNFQVRYTHHADMNLKLKGTR